MKWKQHDRYVIKSDQGYKISKTLHPSPLYIAYKGQEEIGHAFEPEQAKACCQEHFNEQN